MYCIIHATKPFGNSSLHVYVFCQIIVLRFCSTEHIYRYLQTVIYIYIYKSMQSYIYIPIACGDMTSTLHVLLKSIVN